MATSVRSGSGLQRAVGGHGELRVPGASVSAATSAASLLAGSGAAQLGCDLGRPHPRGLEHGRAADELHGGARRGERGAAARGVESRVDHAVARDRDAQARDVAAERAAGNGLVGAAGDVAGALWEAQVLLEALVGHRAESRLRRNASTPAGPRRPPRHGARGLRRAARRHRSGAAQLTGYVAPGAKPTLDDAGQAQVRAAIGRADTPVYVAVLPASALGETGGSADEFVRRLGTTEREPGTYAIVAGGKFRAASTRLKRGVAADLATKAFDAHSNDGLAATLTDFVDRVGAAQRNGGSAPGGGSSNGGGLAILACYRRRRSVRFSRARRRRREEAAQVQELRRIANDDVVALGDDVRAIDLDIEMPGADPGRATTSASRWTATTGPRWR